MTSFRPRSAGLWLAAATVLIAVCGCASIRQAVDSVRGDAPPAEVRPEPSPPPVTTPTPPVDEVPRPVTRSKPKPVDVPAPKPVPVPAPVTRPAVKPPAPVPGPAWLSKCLKAQFAGGVVRCDTDLLLAKPSPTVQVFTRDPARVVAGQILLRKGLPNVYRLYVVP